MLTMPSNQTFPAGYTQASLREAFFGSSSDTNNTSSLNGFWREMSYGQTSATGQVFGPIALSQDYTCDQSDVLAAAAINAADSAVDFTQFTRVALVFPVPSCASYSGLSTLGCGSISSPSKGNLTSSKSWFPVLPNASSAPPVGLYAHELGHGLGLSHSSTDDYSNVPLGPLNVPGTTVEYGDPFSLMGYPYNGSGYTTGHYPAEHKSILHWLNPDGGYQEVVSSGSFTLKPFESSADPRALRVLRDPTTSAWLWLEYRQPLGDVDRDLQYLAGSNVFNGALIHYEDPRLDSLHTYLLDLNPTSAPNNFKTAALTPGHSWSDPHFFADPDGQQRHFQRLAGDGELRRALRNSFILGDVLSRFRRHRHGHRHGALRLHLDGVDECQLDYVHRPDGRQWQWRGRILGFRE